MAIPQGPTQRWLLDFMSDALEDGHRFRVLQVIDDISRECLAAIVDTSIGGARVSRALDRIAELHGYPCMVVSDNGTELTFNAMLKRQEDRKVDWHYIAPGEAHAEWSCRKFQRADARGMLERTPVPVSSSIGLEPMAPSMDDHADHMFAAWCADYNHHRPHSSVAGLTPYQYAIRSKKDQKT